MSPIGSVTSTRNAQPTYVPAAPPRASLGSSRPLDSDGDHDGSRPGESEAAGKGEQIDRYA